MRLDFNPKHWLRSELLRQRRVLVGLGLAAVVLLALLVAVVGHLLSPSAPPPPPVATIQPVPAVQERIITGVVRPGATLSTLLSGYISTQELHGLAYSSVTAGHGYRLVLRDGKLLRFEHDINDDYQLLVSRDSNGRVSAGKVAIPYQLEERLIGGTISDSLFAAVNAIGEEDALALVLADIFACDVDFIRDIRTGDRFKVFVEKRFRDGRASGYGRILAAEFTNQGKTYKAFRYQEPGKGPGFYDQNGNSLRKALLRAPLPFSRVSSGFTMRRFHPVAKTWRAHPAIDYAAPTGTPIMATGDATIVQIGRTSGNGNYIKLRHSGGLETMYLHMSRFAKGMSHGKRVRQGQTIGYVGSTGLATGPHLCYRMTRNGAPVNPAKIQTLPGEPIKRANLPAFRDFIVPLQARLNGAPAASQAAAAAPSAGARL